jgi:TolB-like protein/Flp pilus assembly protein TadD
MAHKTNSFERFWKELKRRKVVHVITVYTATAFVILELVNMVARPLKLPEWTEALVIVILCIGFVIALFLSWIYDITPAGVKKTKPVSATKHSDQATALTSSGWKIATYISGAVIVALVAFNFISKWRLNADITKLDKSIAVLPFFNDSPSDSNQYFINGIMEEVLNNLQKIKDFRVLSRTSTDQYKGQDRPTIPDIAKNLGVSYIVEGSGQKYGNTFRLTVQLIKAKGKENHLWAKSYEQEIQETKDIFRVQSQIAQSIADELKATISPEEKELIEKTPTTSLTAYDFYLRGREEHLNYMGAYVIATDNFTALKKAENYYQKALEYDSTFALAYAGLAFIYNEKHTYSTDAYFSESYLDSTKLLADRALKFNDKLAEAYDAKGEYYNLKGLAIEAIAEYDKALTFNPSDWMAYLGKGVLFMDYDLVQAIGNLQKAASLNRESRRLPALLGSLATAYFLAGFAEKANYYILEVLKLDNDSLKFYLYSERFEFHHGNFEKAIDFLEKAYAIDSNQISTLNGLGYDLMWVGRFNESLKYTKKYLEKLTTLGQITYNSMHRIGYTYWKNGYKKEAGFYFDKQIEYCKTDIQNGRLYAVQKYAYYDLATVYAFLGDKDQALINLRIFSQRKMFPFWTVLYIKTDPMFENIRNVPEFQQIVKDVEAKYNAEHERVKKWLEEQGML